MKLIIDNKEVTGEEGKTVLQLATEAGINIPTLCSHPALEPYGGCRLCLVEITRESWKGSSRLVVSCAFPAENGIIVKTKSDKVIEARKLVLGLLLARCPESEVIQKIAREYGIEKDIFAETSGIKSENPVKNCILCGLCMRVCRDLVGADVISLAYRGVTRRVMTPYGEESSACISCGACSFVCPTGAIEMSDIIPYRYMKTWGTKRELKQCLKCKKYFSPVILNEKIKEKVKNILDDAILDNCPDCRRKKSAEGSVYKLPR